MLTTPLSRKLGLTTPIFQAPMAGVTTPELVLAVGRAGGLGGFGFAYTEPPQIKAAVQAVRSAADVPIHINLFVERPAPEPSPDEIRAAAQGLAPAFEALGLAMPGTLPPPYCPDLTAQIDTVLELRPAVLSFHLNSFSVEVLKAAQQRGILVGGGATTLEEAQQIEAFGADFIIAQGSEAGGHRGTFSSSSELGMIGTLALTRLIVSRCTLPVVAAGGIMDGAGVAAVLALGAQAAQMGTAFLACPESGASAVHKRALRTHDANATTITHAFSGRPARGIRNRFIAHAECNPAPILRFPAQHKLTLPLRTESARQGSPEFCALFAGQAYPLATEEKAGELVARVTREALETVAALVRYT